MANCEYSASCFFLNNTIDSMPKTYECMKNKFCLNNFSACEKFKLYQSNDI